MTRYLLTALLVSNFAVAADSRYIVEFQDEPAIRMHQMGRQAVERQRDAIRARQTAARAAVQRLGGRVTGAADTVANAIFVRIDDSAADGLRALAGVLRVTPVVQYRARLDRVLALSKVPEAWAAIGGAANAGLGIRIAILDSGIDSSHAGFVTDALTAPEGFPKASKEANLQYTSNKVIVARSYEDINDPAGYGDDARDGNSHGTNAAMAAAGVVHKAPAGEISGVAPSAFLGSYKVLGNNGGGGNDGILKGIDDAVKDGMDVLNLSLGSDAVPDPATDPLVVALERAVEAGHIVLVAAGNSGPDPNSIGSPATAPSVIAVGSSSSDREYVDGKASPIDPKRVSGFSSRGPNLGSAMKPDVLATGDNFYTAQSKFKDPEQPYTLTQGTSFATPTVAGAAAVLKAARPGLAEPLYRSLLVNSTTPMILADESAAPVRSQGAGVMNLQNAIQSTIAAAPVSLNFGVGGATADVTTPLKLTNAGKEPATFKLTVVAIDGRSAPALSAAELMLDAGASKTVDVLWKGDGLSGAYQGFLRIDSTANETKGYIPYWYAVASNVPAGISLLEPPSEGKAGASVTVLLRVVDGSGVALLDAPFEVLPAGTVNRDPQYPGLVAVTLPLAAGENTFEFRSGGVSRKHVVTAQ